MKTASAISKVLRRGQRGVSMLFALCALAVLTMGAVALVRSVDTGMLVLGNLGFKKDAVAASSVATENAISWLSARLGAGALDADVMANGYYAAAYEGLDPTGGSIATSAGNLVLVDWDSNGCQVPGTQGKNPVCLTPAGEITVNETNKVRYVITRLCLTAGAVDQNNVCASQTGKPSTVSSVRNSYGYGHTQTADAKADTTPYRIITRTVGVRGTVAYTETLIHF